jgi:transposase
VLPGNTVYEEEPAFVSTPVLALLARFLPDGTTLALEAWHVDEAAAQIILDTISTHSHGSCPLCHVQTARVHSRYTRTVADVPWGAYAVRLHLRVRKFFCDHPTCGSVPQLP